MGISLPELFLYLTVMKFHFLLITLCCCTGLKAQQAKPNVLFIFVDDLRPDLGCYGNTTVKSPHLDSLARKGVVFKNQFVTIPTCGASRMSILTGKLPHKRSDLTNEAAESMVRTEMPETFIEQLKRNGYYTVGVGKISHSADGYVYPYNKERSNQLELPNSWNEMLFNPGKWKTGWNAFFAYADGTDRNTKKANVPPYEAAGVEDDGYPDGLTADLAVEQIEKLAGKEQPFFLGVGFFKPHLPFTAPQKYWDLYNENDIALTPSPDIPANIHKASLHESVEFNQYKSGDEKASLQKPLSDAYARKLRHGYYASISYVDAQIGKVLTALREKGLDKNTIIIVWGDHGWHLGDDRVWGKHTIFDWSLRSAFIIKTPRPQKGFSPEQVVSSVDIYPTIMELCGVKMPYKGDGESLIKATRKTAYSYFKQGITVRTDRYRLTQYYRNAKPDIELYDHKTDPWENKNIAAEQPELVKELQIILQRGNTGVYNTPGDREQAEN